MNDITHEPEERDAPKGKGIYLLPNIFTTAGLFAGFYAIVAATKGSFHDAIIAILIAMVADSLDGRVARLTNTQSPFGREYDSLSDMVGFGIAPALLMYAFSLQHLGKLGWIAAFCYAACTGLRLARFNIQTSSDKRYFCGLPCPPAAGIITCLVWVERIYEWQGYYIDAINAIAIVMAAVLMVSNVRYRSFKDNDFKQHVSFWIVLAVVAGFATIAIDPPEVLFGVGVLYILSGPLGAILRRKNKNVMIENSEEE